jgi:hypothetical protein
MPGNEGLSSPTCMWLSCGATVSAASGSRRDACTTSGPRQGYSYDKHRIEDLVVIMYVF